MHLGAVRADRDPLLRYPQHPLPPRQGAARRRQGDRRHRPEAPLDHLRDPQEPPALRGLRKLQNDSRAPFRWTTIMELGRVKCPEANGGRGSPRATSRWDMHGCVPSPPSPAWLAPSPAFETRKEATCNGPAQRETLDPARGSLGGGRSWPRGARRRHHSCSVRSGVVRVCTTSSLISTKSPRCAASRGALKWDTARCRRRQRRRRRHRRRRRRSKTARAHGSKVQPGPPVAARSISPARTK